MKFRTIVFLFISICFNLFQVSSAFAKDYSFPEVKFKITVQTDGSFLVNEERTYDFDGAYHWADYKIPLKRENFQFSISNFQISDQELIYQENNSEQVGTYYTQVSDGEFYAKWFYSAENQRKTFYISYLVPGGIKLYEDIAQFYWKVIGTGWDKSVGQVSGEVILPGEVQSDLIWCFGHGPLSGNVNIPNKTTCQFRATNLPGKQFLEIRMLFDKSLISNQQLTINNRQLSDLLAEEKSFATKTKAKNLAGKGIAVFFGILTLLGFILFSVGTIKYLKLWGKYGRDLPLPQVNLAGKLHEPPSNLPPAMVEALLKVSKNLSTTVFLSTCLSLVLKRVIKIKSIKKNKWSLFGQSTGYDYSLCKGPAFTSKDLTGGNVKAGPLHDFEKEFLDFLFEDVGGGKDEVSFKEIESYAKTNRMSSYNFWTDFQKHAFDQVLSHGYLEKESHERATKLKVKELWMGFALNLVCVFLPLFFVAIFPILFLIFGLSMIVFPLEIVILVILGIFTRFGEKRSEMGRKEAAGWLAFQKWLKDFSVTKNYPVDSLVLWEKYLVYGTLLGVSVKTLASLPLKFSRSDQNMVFAYYGASTGGNFSASLGSLSTNLGSLSSALTSLSSSTSSYGASGVGSSGGFSGGGGGGGGGSGGGAG